ncbi:ABC transporter ATP-binding protein [Staphylococcus pseudintermedius]|uniref:phenol-soluble modulin export ABC transporter ATP-binding protein PmtC n=1 Tax=Staphylococcus pseudintermedius TaxID=283734 RepID=UPI002ED77B5B
MELINISKTYKDKKILEDITLDFNNNNIIGLIGKNGAGKTTLMKIIVNNITNYEGIVSYSNNSIGYLIEHPKLYSQETGLENLEIFSNIIGNGFEKEYAYSIIKAFGMDSYINKKVKKYSMGMKQKLAIAISLMNKPKYLILDEPTNGMDPNGSVDILKTLKKLVQDTQIKILISSHKLEEIELICDRAIFIQNGSIIKDLDLITTKRLKPIYLRVKPEDYTKSLDVLSKNNKIEKSHQNENLIIISPKSNSSKILMELAKHKIFPKSIEEKKASLRDTYFNLNERKDN